MKLLLHIPDTALDADVIWLQRHHSVIDRWLDCTDWSMYFTPNDLHTFVCLVCEFTSVDVKFDKWKLE